MTITFALLGQILREHASSSSFYPRKYNFFMDLFGGSNNQSDYYQIQHTGKKIISILLEKKSTIMYLGFPTTVTPKRYYGNNYKKKNRSSKYYDTMWHYIC